MGELYSISVPSQTMAVQMARLFKSLSTVFANVWPMICMCSDMRISVGLLFECFATYKGSFFLTMNGNVPQ